MTTSLATICEIASRMGCTCAYTWEALERDVQTLYGAGVSLRQISQDIYGGKITHSTIQRILDGKEPTRAKIRLVLGLPALVEVEPCKWCGEVHTLNGICTKLSAVEVIVRMGEEPRPMQFKIIKPRKPSKPRISYKKLYLETLAQLKEIQESMRIS